METTEQANVQEREKPRYLANEDVVRKFIARDWTHPSGKPRPPYGTTLSVSKDYRVLKYRGDVTPLALWAGDYLVVNGDVAGWSASGIRRDAQKALLAWDDPRKVIMPYSTLQNITGKTPPADWNEIARGIRVVDSSPESWSKVNRVIPVPKGKVDKLVEMYDSEHGENAGRRRKRLVFGYHRDDVCKLLLADKKGMIFDPDDAALDSDMHRGTGDVRDVSMVYDSAKRTVRVTYERHNLGSCLFRYGGSSYLSARSSPGELRNHSDGYFLVELPSNSPRTVADAIASLRPRRVGDRHKRQGEFFFVPTRFRDDADIVRAVRPRLNLETLTPTNGVPAVRYDRDSFDEALDSLPGHVFKVQKEGKWHTFVTSKHFNTKKPKIAVVYNPHVMCEPVPHVCDGEPRYSESRIPQNYMLRGDDIAGVFRPGHQGNKHVAEAMVVTRGKKPRVFVKGLVSHSEHRTVKLSGWHEVFINTAKRSWSIKGRVD